MRLLTFVTDFFFFKYILSYETQLMISCPVWDKLIAPKDFPI